MRMLDLFSGIGGLALAAKEGRNEMKDIGLTEQAKFYENFKDPSPLTDETLEELGFEKNYQGRQVYYWEKVISRGLTLFTTDDGEPYEVLISVEFVPQDIIYKVFHSIPFKTVGSVKLLIEALKGDE